MPVINTLKLSLSCLLLGLTLSTSFAMNITRFKTPEGMQVLYLPEETTPMVDIGIAFFAGSAFEGKHWGLSTLTNELLAKGAGQLDEQQLSEALEQLGAITNNEVTRDLALYELRTLSEPKTRQKALDLFELILSSPSFNSSAFNLTKVQQQHARSLKLQSPDEVANLKIFELLYGQHPYAHDTLGTDKTIDAITLNDVKDFYQRGYSAENATLAIVGDMNPKEAKAFAYRLSKKLARPAKLPKLPKPEQLIQTTTHHIPFPSKQTAIRLAELGISYQSPHYFPLLVGNYTLGGGGLSSQLALEVREKRGLTYGVYSQFQRLEAPGPFMISLATQNKQTNDALNVTRNTLEKFLKEGPSDAELLKAKNFISGNFPIQLSTNAKLLKILLNMGAYQLPKDYLDSYLTHIAAVSKDDIKASFKEQVNLNTLITLTVGQKKDNETT